MQRERERGRETYITEYIEDAAGDREGWFLNTGSFDVGEATTTIVLHYLVQVPPCFVWTFPPPFQSPIELGSAQPYNLWSMGRFQLGKLLPNRQILSLCLSSHFSTSQLSPSLYPVKSRFHSSFPSSHSAPFFDPLHSQPTSVARESNTSYSLPPQCCSQYLGIYLTPTWEVW